MARALGGAIVVVAHEDCGARLNRAVDEPLIHCVPVVKMRADYGILDRYGNPPHPPRLVGTDSSGARSTLRLLPLARMDIRHHPHEHVDDDGRVTVRFDHREDEDVIERKLEAARQRDPEVRGVLQRGSRREYNVSGIRIPLYGWPRLAAKVGLAVGSLAADPEWLRSETAEHLREVLWASPGDATHLALEMAPADPPDDNSVQGALLAPEHLIWTSHTREGLASVCLLLFAEWFLPVPLALTPGEGELVDDYAWLIDPIQARIVREGPLDAVTGDLGRRRPRVEAAIRARSELVERLEREAAEVRARRQQDM